MGRRRDAVPASARPARTPAALPQTIPDPYEAFSDSLNLVDTERRDLAICEAAVESLRVAFWAAGKGLQVIRDARLYRATHPTFEDYVTDRWDMRSSQAYRLIQAWPLAEAISPIGEKIINEAQVRELLPVASRHGQDAAVTVYRTVADVAQEDGGRITAAVLGEVVKVLPADRWDPAEAVEQIRAYLAGDLASPQPVDADPVEVLRAESERLRGSVRRAVSRPSWRIAARQDPGRARTVLAELRALLDEAEREIGAQE